MLRFWLYVTFSINVSNQSQTQESEHENSFFLFDLYLATTADVGSDAKIRTWKILFFLKKNGVPTSRYSSSDWSEKRCSL
jgi:hypothetical protein